MASLASTHGRELSENHASEEKIDGAPPGEIPPQQQKLPNQDFVDQQNSVPGQPEKLLINKNGGWVLSFIL